MFICKFPNLSKFKVYPKFSTFSVGCQGSIAVFKFSSQDVQFTIHREQIFIEYIYIQEPICDSVVDTSERP